MLFVKWIILLTGCADFACSFVSCYQPGGYARDIPFYEKTMLQTGWTECSDWRAFQGRIWAADDVEGTIRFLEIPHAFAWQSTHV